MTKRLLTIVCGFIVVASLVPAVAVADENEPRYLRIIDERGKRIGLEIATIDLVGLGEDERPRIGLVGVAHIADAEFYAAVQQLLDEYEVVLFEAVQPLDTQRGGDDVESRKARTQDFMRFVAGALEIYKRDRAVYPDDLDALQQHISDAAPIMTHWLKRASSDAWGEPLAYQVGEDGESFTLASVGGEEQISYEAEEAAGPLDEMEQHNLQKQLADALSLQYQLSALTYNAAHWRPSDMSINELNEAMTARGLDFSIMGGTLAGTSFPARMVSGLLRLIAIFDAMAQGAVSDMMKVMMIEMLGNEAVMESSMAQFGEGFAAVIIDERNQVVVDDLKAILADEPGVKSIAVLYGAAHLPDLIERLESQMDYTVDQTRWLPAITVDLASSQMDARQVMQMRIMVKRMLQQQLAR